MRCLSFAVPRLLTGACGVSSGRGGSQSATGGLEAGALPAEPLLQLFDPRLKNGDVALQLVNTPLQDLPSFLLGTQPSFDAPQRLNDHLVLLLQSVEAGVNLTEVAKDTGELSFDRFEPPIDGVEPAADVDEALIDGFESPIDRLEAPIHDVEPAVDVGKPLTEELDELLILAVGHRGSPHQQATHS